VRAHLEEAAHPRHSLGSPSDRTGPAFDQPPVPLGAFPQSAPEALECSWQANGAAAGHVSALLPMRTRPAPAPGTAATYGVGHRGIALNPTGLFGSWKANWFGVPVWMFWWKP
jgi:hypothetical protein